MWLSLCRRLAPMSGFPSRALARTLAALLAILGLVLVRSASAEGVNLSWNDCGAAGTSVYSIACDSGKVVPPTLVASFIPPAGVNEYLGASAELIIESSTARLPDWWKHGVGQCRGTGGLATSFDFTSGPSTCTEFSSGLAAGGSAYDLHWQGVSSARLRVQYAIPADSRGPLDPATEYYAFKTRLLPGGASGCEGCTTPVRITLQNIQLFQPFELANDPVISNVLVGTSAFWQGSPGPAPQVSSFSPVAGSPGTIVTIQGANLTGATSVRFGGENAIFTIISSEVITATVSTLALSGKITVNSFSGIAGSATDFIVAPTITSFSPTQGPAGLPVMIVGRNFGGATAVRFNGTNASFTVKSEGQIATTVPAGATSGPITVVNAGGTGQSASAFTVASATQPVVSSFTPNSGAPGRHVTINGFHLGGATFVGFGGVGAAFAVSSDAALFATVPANARSGPITVTSPGGTATSAGVFTVAPVITSFNPSEAGVGSVISLHGFNFTGTTQVEFNGVNAAFEVTSDTLIRATVPPRTTSGLIAATNPGGTGNSPTTFRVGINNEPQIDNVSPSFGAPGTLVSIFGQYFVSVTSVRFGGVEAEFQRLSSSLIRATVPAGARTGPISVTTVAGTDESNGPFFVNPMIVSFEPRQGVVGTVVVLRGRNFTGVSNVRFAGLDAAFLVVNDSLIQATVPVGAVNGALTVTGPGGTTAGGGFIVLSPEGPNLVRDPSFETSTAAWTPIGGATLARVEGGYDGTFALQVLGPDTTGEFGANDSPNTVLVTPASGIRYRFGAWVMKPAGSAHVELRAREYSNRVRTQTVTTGRFTPDGEWRYFQGEIVTLAAGATIDFQIIATGFEPRVEVRFDQVSVRQVGNPPHVVSPARVDATPGSPVEIVVTSSDPAGGAIRSLTADLSVLPAGHDATFTVDPGNTRGVLRWTPEVEDGAASYRVEFRAAGQLEVTSTTEIRVAAVPDPTPLVWNSSFEDAHVSGWKGYRAASLERVSGGRTGLWSLRVRSNPDSTGTYGINDSPNWVKTTGNTPGKRYRVSCWVRGVARSGTGQIRIREYLGPAAIGAATYSRRIDLTPTWTKLVVEHVTGAAGSTLDLHILSSPNQPTGEILIDDVMIREVAPPAMASRFGSRATEEVLFERPTVMPNPFRGRATLAMALATRGPLRVDVYDVNGRRVRNVFDHADAAAGSHRFDLDGRDDRGARLEPGMFFYRIESGRGVQHGRFVVLE